MNGSSRIAYSKSHLRDWLRPRDARREAKPHGTRGERPDTNTRAQNPSGVNTEPSRREQKKKAQIQSTSYKYQTNSESQVFLK